MTEAVVSKMKKVYIRYKDHLLFKNCSHKKLKPVIRETVGFLAKETSEALYVLWDKSIEKIPNEKNHGETGLVLLKSDLIQVKTLD